MFPSSSSAASFPAPPAGAAAVEATKASARASRLKLSNSMADKLQSEWQTGGLVTCAAPVRGYWLCRQTAGFAVVLPSAWGGCRDENAAMHACLSAHAHDEEAFGAFRDRRLAEMADARNARMAAAAAGVAAETPAAPTAGLPAR